MKMGHGRGIGKPYRKVLLQAEEDDQNQRAGILGREIIQTKLQAFLQVAVLRKEARNELVGGPVPGRSQRACGAVADAGKVRQLLGPLVALDKGAHVGDGNRQIKTLKVVLGHFIFSLFPVDDTNGSH